jgi:hypothetical protein
MALTTIEQSSGLWTAVNTDQITYVRQDTYGTAIHFASGEHIICALEFDTLLDQLAQSHQRLLAPAH